MPTPYSYVLLVLAPVSYRHCIVSSSISRISGSDRSSATCFRFRRSRCSVLLLLIALLAFVLFCCVVFAFLLVLHSLAFAFGLRLRHALVLLLCRSVQLCRPILSFLSRKLSSLAFPVAKHKLPEFSPILQSSYATLFILEPLKCNMYPNRKLV
ncbi:hypothetical protein FB451DRAFT_1222873 [Mycena latifolia]|nr:hypothetical protein FB451DRAFT_1222873 [Mycena latifolia]